jgi:hypothetical protein
MSTEEALRTYVVKRDLDVSGEPGGGEPGERPRFVIQRHDPSSLHDDFRRNPVSTQPESVLSGRTNQDAE